MPTSSKQPASETGIQSLQRAAAILRCFTQSDTDLGVTAISRQLGLHKSTVSRLLSTLKQEGFVEQNPETGKYQLGLGLITLAGIVLDRIDLRQVAYPYIRTLARLTQETVNVVVLDNSECVNIGGVASPRPIQYIGRIGRRTPVHCTAAGKVLLAYLPSEEQKQILAKNLSRFTVNTVVDVQTLEQLLLMVRKQGYAITHQEYQLELSDLAAPVCDHTGHVFAAVVVSGPTYRISPDKIEPFVKAIKETAQEISTRLGCVSGDK